MPPTVGDRLHDILQSIVEIEQITLSANIEKFKADRVMRFATERLLEIVCEASRKLPDSIKDSEPDIDWRKMGDFGNLLRHAYHSTDVDTVWQIVRNHLPALKTFAERRIRALTEE